MNRCDVDKHLQNVGYSHPETTNINKSLYKIYSGDSNSVYKSTNSANIYRTKENAYETDENGNEIISSSTNSSVPKEEICPVCQTPALFKCPCKEYGELLCKNNHYWYFKDNTKIVGDPHKT